jgi:BirA family biotin operon repressor/biotin-[acetyl-CoA-carboxylase] ligase
MSFDVAHFERERAARGLGLGASVHWAPETTSTNDLALAAAKQGAPHGALFGAETQTKGRGRRGSAWVSTPGAGLWISLLLRPSFGAELAPGLSLCAGLAVRAAAAARVDATVQVKWPNDVLADGRKLAGILVESQVSGATLSGVVVGIGINCAQREFPPEIASLATSLSLLSARDARRESLLLDVLEAFEQELSRLTTQGLAGMAEALRAHDALLGKRLRIEGRAGTGAGIDSSGRLCLDVDDGGRALIASGHVELLG